MVDDDAGEDDLYLVGDVASACHPGGPVAGRNVPSAAATPAHPLTSLLFTVDLSG